MNTVLFACTHNAGRSQMAAAFFNRLADSTLARAISAGTEPARQVHPEVVTVMREVPVDLTAAKPRKLTAEIASEAKLVVTMGCEEACPVMPGARYEAWSIGDPKGKPLEQVRAIRDEIRDRIQKLVTAKGWGRADLAENEKYSLK